MHLKRSETREIAMHEHLIEVIRKARKGGQEALEKLYKDFVPLVRAIAFDETGDIHGTSDVVQDVFFTLVKDLHRLKKPERFREWLIQITRRRAVDLIRSRTRERRRTERLDDQLADRTEPVLGTREREILLRAIEDLQPPERLAVELFHLEGQPVKRVIEILGLPRSTVYAVLIRARSRLKHRLAALGITEVSL